MDTTSDGGGRFELKLEMAYAGLAVEVLAMHPGLALGVEYAMPGLPVIIRLGANPVVFAVKTVTPEGDPVVGAAVDPDATSAVTLALRPLVGASVKIQRESGEVLPDCEWQVWLPELVTHRGSLESRALERRLLPHITVDTKVTTDAEGRFALQGMVTGLPYSVRGGPRGSDMLSLEPLVPAGQPNQEVIIIYPL